MSNQRSTYIVRTILVLGIILLINIVAQYFHNFVDLTEEKRFTLSDSTMDLVREVDNIVYVRVLLDGEFPAGFKRLQAATRNRLNQFRTENPLIEFGFENPSEGTVKEINERRQSLSEIGILPQNLMVVDGEKRTEKLIYPYAIVNYADKQVIVNLSEPQGINTPQEITLNNSINLLEYKFANAFEKLMRKERPNIVFSTGHGELSEEVTAKLETELKPYFDTGRINLDSIFQLDKAANVLIMAAPKTTISSKTQLVIDQYLMNGGNILWLVEKFKVNLDSINQNEFYVPEPIETGLDDLLFKYGVRVKNNLILDLECSQIPQVIGMQGDKPQTSLFPWYYHPLTSSKSNHPVVNGIDRVNFKFPSSIEILEEVPGVKSTVLMSSSRYSRFQVYPMRLSFEILRVAPEPDKFNKPNENIAVLLEGEFESFFKNRLTGQQKETLNQIGSEFKERSVPTKQIIVSDADFIKNLYDPESSRISSIGYNKWEQNTYSGNKSFIINAIEFLADDYGLLEARSKDYKLRLLDKVKTSEEKSKWQMINLVLPIVLVWLFAFVFFYFRRRKYAS